MAQGRHSHQTAIGVLAVAIFPSDNLREKELSSQVLRILNILLAHMVENRCLIL